MQITSSRSFISLSVSLAIRSREIQEREGGGGGGKEGGKRKIRYIFLSFLIHVSTHIFIALSSSHFLCSKGKYGRDVKSPIFTS